MKKEKFLGPLVLLFLALASFQVTGREDGEPIPDTLFWSDGGLQFVALDRAVDPAGNIDTHLLKASRAESLAKDLDVPMGENGCSELNGWSSTDLSRSGLDNLELALQGSDHFLIGRVLGLRIGYYGLRLGYLALIETEETLAGSPNVRYYVFFPKGEFRFQGKKYCITNDFYPDVPTVGDRILVMHLEQNSGSAIIGVGPNQLVVLPSEGPPSVGLKSNARDNLSFKSSAEMIAWAKDFLSKAGKI